MTPDEATARLRGLVGPDDSTCVAPNAFEYIGRVEGDSFRLRRLSQGPLTRFAVPDVIGRVNPGPSGAVVSAEIRPRVAATIPTVILLAYASLRTLRDADAPALMAVALVIALGLTMATLAQETGRARRLLETLGRPIRGSAVPE